LSQKKNLKSADKNNNINLNNTSLKKKNSSKKIAYQNQKSQINAILIFAASVLLFFITIFEGESIWSFLHSVIWGLFGFGSILWSILPLGIAINISIEKSELEIIQKKMIMLVFVNIFLCTTLYIFTDTVFAGNILSYPEELLNLYKRGTQKHGLGFFGGLFGMPLFYLFGTIGSKIISIVILFIVSMFLTGTSLFEFLTKINNFFIFTKRIFKKMFEMKNDGNSDVVLNSSLSNNFSDKNKNFNTEITEFENEEKDINVFDTSVLNSKNSFRKEPKILPLSINVDFAEAKQNGDYCFPPIGLLCESLTTDQKDIAQELQTNGQMLVATLNDFGVQTRIVDICRGPSVTRYELQPAAGVKISKITNLSDDIALNLAASGVRIEAPIPLKSAVGVEIPNKIVSTVNMRELVFSKEFSSQKSKLTVILGRDIAGNVALADLAKMPHLLIAGSTGSGKSVCINSFLISLIYKATPSEIRFLMIDPKVVELLIYNGIPHLLVPVVTDPRKAAGALSWAVSEMLKRYKLFAQNNVRDIFSYNKMIKKKINLQKTSADKILKVIKKEDNIGNKEEFELIPQIVIVIDELADLMMVAPREVEDSICRLAQMARAAGMHLVIATQRPSVDVITGIIKANIPSRIALAVSSQVDSRTIIDTVGAEKLLGRGDMLFSPIGVQKPIRIQGCFVTDKEIEAIIEFIKKKDENDYDQKVIDEIEKKSIEEKNIENSDKENTAEDPMFKEAVRCVVELNKASTSLLQRKLRLGYARAGRLIDQMEEKGIVGPADGAKARRILISKREFLEFISK
jgi:S-DNA-T family DNA segregation ATPase FtsK/SpoIIIE